MTRIMITLENGVILTGEPENVVEIARASGYRSGLYHSASKGWMFIQAMDTQHIRNALSKIIRQWYQQLPLATDKEFIAKLLCGPQSETYSELLSELEKRVHVQ